MISQAYYTVLRLKPGEELLAGIGRRISELGSEAAFIASSVGSLSSCAMRMAGRSETVTLEGTFEVVSLSGTIDADGEHLHISISDPDGRMTGGHLMRGSTVRTTMELVIGILPEMRFVRKHCELSGYDELCIEKKENV